ncbi:MAG: transposase [Eggerthellaceae bacterium]|nr:transposase [Eggerthellaceae bacterium]
MPGKRYDRQFKLAAAKLVSDGEMPVRQISEELEVPDNTLRRWAMEYEKNGEAAFPGSGSPTLNKDYQILKLKKQVEELTLENDLLKKFQAFLRQNKA